ncbi:tRNA uridine-5-carboxymethylaminomethyl(34) synthesis GTPase MnmE [Salibacter sp.]|uniref:tRNA uridine-5-carboxymethylaminomethyl(34) synthesis GTPase MnmE n=1 Tax=Salibacter sp. TaxID=2010995 RepID=UPI00287019D2|nr:tRNA uridine-5-carboxymethylaminomethyl(34) synthesis GTPase MnmE [Salibacter sp.]MDR9488688.1 tRNA uridine-5-carboxymethylaminomethyl(34) synthesis GTPase MnmE [Salibacter sp.]
MHSNTEDTICALASGSGPAAISVIRISGPKAIEICNTIFKGKDLNKVDSHTIHFGTIREDDVLVDEVLVSVFKGPNSYTGEDVIELSCHGSPFIRQKIINLLLDRGARSANAGEFTLRAFMNKKMDLSQAEAVADLISSESEASHKLAMQQMRGGFSSEIGKLREELINFASLIELELDFSEEDVEFADRSELKDLILKVHKLAQGLIESFKVGNVLKNGVPVVIAGKPNAGKSTLLNQILKEERAIVSSVEGTTRDTIEDEAVLNGVIFRFIDTAGIRETKDEVEAIGVKKTLEQIETAAIVVYMFDVNTFTPSTLRDVIKELEEPLSRNGAKLLLVGNKIDQKDEEMVRAQYKDFDDMILISAKDNQNVEKLSNKLVDLIETQEVSSSDVMVTNSRHYEALTKADASLMNALNGLETGITGDFIAMDIRQSLHYLGEITGQITSDDLLGNIFSNFCIGK